MYEIISYTDVSFYPIAGKKSAAVAEDPIGNRFGRIKANLKMGVLGLPNVGTCFNLKKNIIIDVHNPKFQVKAPCSI